VGCGALTAPAQRACAAQHPVHGRSRAADSHGRTPKLPSLGHSGACPELLRCIPGRREPLGAIAWLKEKPYIGVLSKKRGVNAFPYSMRVRWAGWFRPTEMSARGGKLGCMGRGHSFELGYSSATER